MQPTTLSKIISQAVKPMYVVFTFSVVVPIKKSDLDIIVVVGKWKVPLN